MMNAFNTDLSSQTRFPSLTTEIVQKLLDENQQFILAAHQCVVQGRAEDSAKYLSRIQTNLTFLAANADLQPFNQGARIKLQLPLQALQLAYQLKSLSSRRM
mmetsp:Transcript_9195/g.15719  ORF Transcript_9195/g.15719 Transcript_9195/m.15719 type:complete len:102 (+) Transcript_9195:34-339(+)